MSSGDFGEGRGGLFRSSEKVRTSEDHGGQLGEAGSGERVFGVSNSRCDLVWW